MADTVTGAPDLTNAPVAAAKPEPTADSVKQEKLARRLIAEVIASEKSMQRFLTRARKINRLYKKADDQSRNTKRRFSLLWSNTETIRPAVYSRPPQPVVTRRFGDADPVGRVTAEVLERALKYSMDAQDYDGVLRAGCLDYTLIARGQTWERYVPTFGAEVTPKIPLQVKTDGSEDFEEPDPDSVYHADEDGNRYDAKDVQYGDDGKPYALGTPYRPVEYEESITDYVNWEDYGHNAARTWDEVDLNWRRTYLSKEQLTERFGKEIADQIPLDANPTNRPRSVEDEFSKKAAVYECWVKSEKKVYWISKSYSAGPLDVRDDPLKLDGFFPCPRPLLGTVGNDSLIPTPDYTFYEDQAEEIDDLTAKIAELEKALKVVGFSAGQDFSKIVNLMNASNTTLIAVPDWVKMKEGGGVAGMIEWWPIAQVVAALQAMIGQRQQLLNDVYQITGIADILRGMNDPRATATAESIKGQWGTLRIRDRQKEMQRFARDDLRIKGGVIASKFDITTLKAMTQVKLPMAEEKAALQQQLQQQAMAAQMQMAQAAPQVPGPMPGGPMGAAQPGLPPQAGPPVGAPGHPVGRAQMPPPSAQPGQPPQMMGHTGGPPMPPEPTDDQKAILESPTWEDVIGRLRDNATRCFTIDIETDSTIEPNEAEEKQNANELIQALGQLVAQWGPAIQAQPALAPLAGEIIKWALRKYRAGTQIEDIVDRTINDLVAKLKTQSEQPKGAQAPPPDPAKLADTQAKVAIAGMTQQTDMAAIQQKAQEAEGKAQIEGANLQLRQQELQIQQGDQQIKVAALMKDPTPQSFN